MAVKRIDVLLILLIFFCCCGDFVWVFKTCFSIAFMAKDDA